MNHTVTIVQFCCILLILLINMLVNSTVELCHSSSG